MVCSQAYFLKRSSSALANENNRPATNKTFKRLTSGGGVLPSNRLMGMCCWLRSHFHDWIDYNGVAFSIGANRVTRMGSHI